MEVTQESWREEILAQLDRAAELFTYPGLPNEYFALAAQRVTAFRGPDEWLLVFQVVGWGIRQAAFENLVIAFGNHLENPGAVQADVVVVTSPGGESPFDDRDELRLGLEHLVVEIRGHRHELRPTLEQLRAAGVDGADMPGPARVVRLLAHEFAGEMFLADAELLVACGRDAVGLERLLELDAWRQPDLVALEQPSDIACLRSLADALATGDADRYTCPEQEWNTDWREQEG